MKTRTHPADGGVQKDLFEWETMTDDEIPEGERCVNYPECRNRPPGNNSTCPECLDEMRRRDREDESPAYQ